MKHVSQYGRLERDTETGTRWWIEQTVAGLYMDEHEILYRTSLEGQGWLPEVFEEAAEDLEVGGLYQDAGQGLEMLTDRQLQYLYSEFCKTRPSMRGFPSRR